MSEPNQPAHQKKRPRGKALVVMTLGALGVVYGDIGTSPLYALRECFSPKHHISPTPENVLGVLSLITWSLMFVVTFKYVTVMLQADNRGEGGIVALLALVRTQGGSPQLRRRLVMLALFGAALLYGDGVITPAVSVLGALEGVSVATPALGRFVVPAAVVILLGLFVLQRFGTDRVGKSFAPIMVVWFSTIAFFGMLAIIKNPLVLKAVNPWYAIEFFVQDGVAGFLILGSVVLVLTGAEALYADMGHFGRSPIRRAWLIVVLPALLINYYGQGALLLTRPEAATNPFYELVPRWFLYPMVVIATLAAITASQALISGSFSITRQAVQLGYWPRMTIQHTSHKEEGQIYVPEVNWILMVLCISCVLIFRSSDNLTAAYGIAVTGTMTCTSMLFGHVAYYRWHWPPARVALVTGAFLFVDLSFLGANLIKVADGGWFPLILGIVVFVLMTTWKLGRTLLLEVTKSPLTIVEFIQSFAKSSTHRVPGVAVFMTSDPDGVPPVLLHHLKHNQVMHSRVILMSIHTEEVPQVDLDDRIEYQDLGHGFHRVKATYGFMESPDVPDLINRLPRFGLVTSPNAISYYLGRETLLPTGKGRIASWRKRVFIVMTRNAQTASSFFNLPPNRVVEMGAQIQI
ncbi:MAG: KUP/HAK/KT family potassium transporter [Gemmatimonadota bacterium]